MAELLTGKTLVEAEKIIGDVCHFLNWVSTLWMVRAVFTIKYRFRYKIYWIFLFSFL
jgi:hypothetical protein